MFFDFDNTITLSDVLDRLIERFSASAEWRDWEEDWRAGRMSTRECLRRQLRNLRASPDELCEFVLGTEIDPAFARIAGWATANGVELRILSDNFSPLIKIILEREGLAKTLVFANEFDVIDDKLEARFPFHDPACLRCAHCKAQHLRGTARRPRIFVGDGLSDVCAALIADVVFAKDSLAAELEQRGVLFRAYQSLADVLRYLEEHHSVDFRGSVAANDRQAT